MPEALKTHPTQTTGSITPSLRAITIGNRFGNKFGKRFGNRFGSRETRLETSLETGSEIDLETP
jgi:hypothetical protein